MAQTASEPPAELDVPAPTVRWDPCPSYQPDADSPVEACAECGWLADDHADGREVVVTLPLADPSDPTSPLRRAS